MIRFELTHRLADIAGFRGLAVDVPAGAPLSQALACLRRELQHGPGSTLLRNGALIPSVLVIVDGEACAAGGDPVLAEGATIHLLLPVAGG